MKPIRLHLMRKPRQMALLLEIFYQEGDEVPVLTNVAVIGNAGEDSKSFMPSALAQTPAQTLTA